MKIKPVTYNYTHRLCFSSKFNSSPDINNTYNLLKSSIWRRYREAFPEKYAKKASLILNQIQNMTGAEYLNLTQEQKIIIDKITPYNITQDAQENYDIACSLRTYAKEHFGDFKNYTILCIGRSLASCCETLKHMGADIKFLPLTGLSNFFHTIYNITPKGISAYEKYLSSIGLTKEIIQNSPKHKYIMTDYTSTTGLSLNNAYEFLTWDELLSNSSNIETLSTRQFLDFPQDLLLSEQTLKKYSPICQLDLGNLENVFAAADPYKYNYQNYRNSLEHIQTKLFRFKMFELLEKNKNFKKQ